MEEIGNVCACGGELGAVSASDAGEMRYDHLMHLLTYGESGATWLRRLEAALTVISIVRGLWRLEQCGTFRTNVHM